MPKIYGLASVPTVEEYQRALDVSEANEFQRSILQALYCSPDRTATATEIARLVGRPSHTSINIHFGKLGHRIADILQIDRSRRGFETSGWWLLLADGWSVEGGRFAWRMYPQVAEALEVLGWVGVGPMMPEEINLPSHFVEGANTRVAVNSFERSPAARQACIDSYGYDCVICGFNFARTYGIAGERLIHVHHLTPLAEIGESYVVDPAKDLIPVCPNCHAIIHQRKPPYTVEEVRALLQMHGGN